jgi:hypothetical protein
VRADGEPNGDPDRDPDGDPDGHADRDPDRHADGIAHNAPVRRRLARLRRNRRGAGRGWRLL